MGDQARWFKLWCSAPGDDTIQNLSPALRWAWAAFGAYTKLHGTGGVITISPTNTTLAAQLGVDRSALISTLGSLPNICLGTAPVRWPHGHEKNPVCAGEFMWGSHPLSERGSRCLEEWCSRHGKITVTWRNWNKYQEDTTQAQRGAASRSKRRREEIRGDETRREEKEPESKAVGAARRKPPALPATVEGLVSELGNLEAYVNLDVRGTILRCEQWCHVNSKHLTKGRVVNWLNGDAKNLVVGNGRPSSRARINDAWKNAKTGDIKL